MVAVSPDWCWRRSGPSHSATLLDSSQRRTAFLRRSVVTLGWADRVSVAEGRAESLARDPRLRAAFSLVVARSFAPPAVTAEIGGAFLRVDGCLAVSEPRQTRDQAVGAAGDTDPAGSGDRWPEAGLADLGLGPVMVGHGSDARLAVSRRTVPVDGPVAPCGRDPDETTPLVGKVPRGTTCGGSFSAARKPRERVVPNLLTGLGTSVNTVPTAGSGHDVAK